MKRLKLVIIILLMLPLTGCINEYNATKEQNDAVAEYMAGLLLEYDKDYDQELTSMDELTDDDSEADGGTLTPSPATSIDDTTSGNSDNGITDTSTMYTLSEVIGNSNFELNYKSYQIADTYPEDADSALFVLTPREGYHLLVVTFTVKNISDGDQTLNLSEDNILYQLEVASGTEYTPLLTLLENDLQYLEVKLGSEKTKKALLVFEVLEGTNISNINLVVSKGNNSNTTKIK